MRIYTLSQPNLLLITTETFEPIYVESIPFSLQQKLNIGKNITIINSNGNQMLVKTNSRIIDGIKASKIIKTINGYSKVHNQIIFR